MVFSFSLTTVYITTSLLVWPDKCEQWKLNVSSQLWIFNFFRQVGCFTFLELLRSWWTFGTWWFPESTGVLCNLHIIRLAHHLETEGSREVQSLPVARASPPPTHQGNQPNQQYAQLSGLTKKEERREYILGAHTLHKWQFSKLLPIAQHQHWGLMFSIWKGKYGVQIKFRVSPRWHDQVPKRTHGYKLTAFLGLPT